MAQGVFQLDFGDEVVVLLLVSRESEKSNHDGDSWCHDRYEVNASGIESIGSTSLRRSESKLALVRVRFMISEVPSTLQVEVSCLGPIRMT